MLPFKRFYRRCPWQKLLHQLIPTYCLLCSRRLGERLLCDDCEMDLPWLNYQRACQQCAIPLTTDSRFCGHCLHRPPAFQRAFIPFLYDYPLDYLISSFKYRRNLTSGKALASLLIPFMQNAYDDSDCEWPSLILPVPLHWRRRLVRSFNQSSLLSGALAKGLPITSLDNGCRRRRSTPSQKGLDRQQRQKNFRGAFTLQPAAAATIQGQCIAILDDVVTTTATARELANLLLKNGAREVHLWAVARTPERR